jgi:acyl dehydratase
VQWLAPIRPGARVKARATVLETRASRSRPDLGFVKLRLELVDASEQPIMRLMVSPMFGRRDARSPPGAQPHASRES